MDSSFGMVVGISPSYSVYAFLICVTTKNKKFGLEIVLLIRICMLTIIMKTATMRLTNMLAKKSEVHEMTMVNMLEAKTNLSKLIKMLENREEDVIYLARDGKQVAQITLVPENDVSKRIGIAEGELVLPDGFDEAFDELDGEIADLFEGSRL